MNAQGLFQAGKLDEAVQALGAELRDNPVDAKRRTFLFELLCFTGDYQRAEKQLDVLASEGRAAEMGALLYRAALHAERIRQAIFEKQDYPLTGPEADAPISGTINGKPFQSFSDADPRLGERLEVFAAGDYLWIPLQHKASVELQAPIGRGVIAGAFTALLETFRQSGAPGARYRLAGRWSRQCRAHRTEDVRS